MKSIRLGYWGYEDVCVCLCNFPFININPRAKPAPAKREIAAVKGSILEYQ
jgi:hypothetical protein